MLADASHHTLEILHHVSILDPDDSKTPRAKESLPRQVVIGGLLAVVRRAFKLNYQLFRWAAEIHDVRADALLAAEFPVVQAGALQCLPQSVFRRC